MISQLMRRAGALFNSLFCRGPSWEDFDRSQRNLQAYQDVIEALKAEHGRQLDAVYLERNRLVAALAKHHPSGTARTPIRGWNPEWWNCVFVDLPTGQASWHFHDRDASLFAELPPYRQPWDGHSTEQKYLRLARLSTMRQSAAVGGFVKYRIPPAVLAGTVITTMRIRTQAALDVLAERRRQIETKGWTPQHDDEHDAGELAGAGASYALHASDTLHPLSQGDAYRNGAIPPFWLWSSEHWKPGSPRRNLVKAGALILAEIERLDRASNVPVQGSQS